jgi:HAMP domain-containing protein
MKQTKSSIRWSLFAIALLPVLAVGFAWFATTALVQAKDIRDSLLLGAIQSAGVYSQNLVDQMQGGKTSLSDAAFVAKIQSRMSELFSLKLMPLRFAVITNGTGKVIAAFDAQSYSQAGSLFTLANPFDAWKGYNPDVSEPISNFAALTLSYKTPVDNSQFSSSPNPALTTQIIDNGKPLTLVGYPMVGGIGSTIMALDMAPIEARVNQASITALIALLVILILAGVVASLFANQIGQRLGILVKTADQISKGEDTNPIKDTSNDEIGQLGQAIERLRISIEMLMKRQAKRS